MTDDTDTIEERTDEQPTDGSGTIEFELDPPRMMMLNEIREIDDHVGEKLRSQVISNITRLYDNRERLAAAVEHSEANADEPQIPVGDNPNQ